MKAALIYLLSLLFAALARPEVPTEVLREHESEGIIDLLDIPVHHNETEVKDDMEKILAEDWADTWEPPEYMKEWFPYRFTGVDGDGAVVVVKEFGKWRFTQLIKEKGQEGAELFDKYYAQYLHRFFKEAESHGGAAVVIMDWEGFGMDNFNNQDAFKLGLRQVVTLEKTSRVLKRLFVVNTNFAAQTMMNLCRPLLGTALQGAEIYGTQRSKWLPRLLKALPKDVLPPHYFVPEVKVN